MSNVLHWIKANVFIVVFLVLMIVAAVSLPLVAKSLNATVREEVDTRARKFGELNQLDRTSVTPPSAGAPGEAQSVLVNNNLLIGYERQVNALSDDAERVRELALEFNRKDRGVLMDNVFPSAPPELRQIIPNQFHERMGNAYVALLAEIGAGQPPDPAVVDQAIQAEQGQFLAAQVAKPSIDQLTEEELASMRKYLTTVRLSKYVTQAEGLNFYAERNDLDIPASSATASWGELFNWQWQYWIWQDILYGLADANDGSTSVLDAPVKRLESVRWTRGLPMNFSAGAGGSNPSGGAAFGGGGGNTSGGGAAKPPTGTEPDFKKEAPTDYASSFTGRVTNPLYDVVNVELTIVADASRLPDVIDALSRRNFITVLHTTLKPRDAFADSQFGFVYGDQPVAEVRMELETIWLREWTKEFMPDATRMALNIPLPQPPATTTTTQ